jgi:hypothetical protein
VDDKIEQKKKKKKKKLNRQFWITTSKADPRQKDYGAKQMIGQRDMVALYRQNTQHTKIERPIASECWAMSRAYRNRRRPAQRFKLGE